MPAGGGGSGPTFMITEAGDAPFIASEARDAHAHTHTHTHTHG
jgi:hypothetical protein